MKILILSSYYNRPKLIRNMLKSLIEADKLHQDWELAILDDNSPIPVQDIVEEEMVGYLEKIRIENSNMSFEDKMQRGLVLGEYANRAIRESEADIGILLCDDDELVPEYLKQISDYFETNEYVKYCYSKIYVFNPFVVETKLQKCDNNKYNQWIGPINPVGKVDASQVAWRLSCCKEDQAWFQETTKKSEEDPFLHDTDYGFFSNLHSKCGLCYQSNLYAQYKGIHEHQLLWHKKGNSGSLRIYFDNIEQLGKNELL